MQVLNAETLKELLTDCYRIPDFRGIIAFASQRERRVFMYELLIRHSANQLRGVREIQEYTTTCSIEYANGSTIRLIEPSFDTRGYRCHTALYHKNIQRDMIDWVGRMEINYRPWYAKHLHDDWGVSPDPIGHMDEDENNVVLDNFLNEFKITDVNGCGTTT